MTHLQAFKSDDAKRGRIWRDEHGILYRRDGAHLSTCRIEDIWTATYEQVASMEGVCSWENEISIFDAMRALISGFVLVGHRGWRVRLNGENLETDKGSCGDERWIGDPSFEFFGMGPYAIENSGPRRSEAAK